MSRIEKVVLATNNPKKLTELRRVMAESGLAVEVLGLADFPAYPEPIESERSFEGNAFIKAEAAAKHTGLPSLADDSGLEVDELNSMPGVRSARWAGPDCDDAANNALLLAQLAGVPADQRGHVLCAPWCWCRPLVNGACGVVRCRGGSPMRNEALAVSATTRYSYLTGSTGPPLS